MKKSKNIIVVGNNRGIGKVLTEHFLNLGHSVIGTSRLKISSIEHENYQHVKVDITKENDLDKLLLVVKKSKTVVNLILNCTALTSNELLLISEKKTFRELFEVNVIAHYEICKKFSKYLLLQKEPSSIIGFSSIHADTLIEGASFYAVTKKCVETLTKSFAVEFIKTGISFYCLVLSYTKNIGLAKKIEKNRIQKHLEKNTKAKEIEISKITKNIDIILNKENKPRNNIIRIGC